MTSALHASWRALPNRGAVTHHMADCQGISTGRFGQPIHHPSLPMRFPATYVTNCVFSWNNAQTVATDQQLEVTWVGMEDDVGRSETRHHLIRARNKYP